MNLAIQIQNARDSLSEIETMEREALDAGDKLLHIHLGFSRASELERLRNLERAQRLEQSNTCQLCGERAPSLGMLAYHQLARHQ